MKKWILFLLGVQLLAIGIICNTRTNLGVAAFSSVFYAISIIFGLSLGQASMILYLALILIQIILLRKITPFVLLQLPFSFIFSFITDFYDKFILFNELSTIQTLLLLCTALTCTSLGVYLTVQCHIATSPVEGIVATISDVFHLDFSKVKNGVDISMIFITVLMCLFLRKPIYGIGMGTLISAIAIGRLVSVWQKLIPLHIKST